jgi:isopenicillin-N epimerase
MKSHYLLAPEITYLNNGSFGACPKSVFENYQFWQLELEKEPTQFITKRVAGYLQESKMALAKYVVCNVSDFFFVQNPTFAVNTIMRSLNLKKGDEVLSTNHEYGAMDRTWRFYENKMGIKYVRQPISLPIVSKEQIVTEFFAGYNANTKVIFLNHISSATALLFPVKEIVARAKELGLITIVDGAHVPGHIDLNVQELDPDFYTGTVHKWMGAPKGCSFLYVKKEFQSILEPLVVSWGYNGGAMFENSFLDCHQLQGTRDISAFLTVPKAIAFMNENNWSEKIQVCNQLILDNYEQFCDLLGSKPICPVTSEFLGQMCSIPIQTNNVAELKVLLYEKYKIEIPVMTIDNQVFLRISVQVYNSQEDLDVLRLAILDILKTTDLLVA